jgi:hypothetical protein
MHSGLVDRRKSFECETDSIIQSRPHVLMITAQSLHFDLAIDNMKPLGQDSTLNHSHLMLLIEAADEFRVALSSRQQ